IPVEKVRGLLRVAQEPISLQMPMGEDGATNFGDFIEDKRAASPANATAYGILKEHLSDMMTGLSVRQKQILQLRFGLRDGRARRSTGPTAPCLSANASRRRRNRKALSSRARRSSRNTGTRSA